MDARQPEVLIAGAGPTGLVLALWLTRMGVRVRIFDKTSEPGTTSRALAVQARTLELYAQVGIAGSVVEHGRKLAAANLWVAKRRAAHIAFGDIGTGVSPFPYALVYPQDEHERMLIDCLGEAGVTVERRTELLRFEEANGRLIARLRRADGSEESCEAAYLAGCDGAHSTVRQVLGIGFEGGTYEHLFYVADVSARGAAMNGEVQVGLDRADFLAMFPLRGDGRARLVGAIRERPAKDDATLTWEDVGKTVIGWMGLEIDRVNWFSTYRVHHRVARRFQAGRAFLLGDAAHIHSPVGGQGMNTGIGDAINLAWKLAAVLQGKGAPALTDTYEPERIGFARRLVRTTDEAFTAVTSAGPIARFVRLRVVPSLLPLLFSFRAMRRLMYRTLSQTSIEYRKSALSEGRAGSVHGGDRLPWVQPDAEAAGNFAPLTSLDWQVHVYGSAAPDLAALCRERRLPLHLFPWSAAARHAGLRRDAVYLVRPDSYVALADPAASPRNLAAYLDARHVATRDR